MANQPTHIIETTKGLKAHYELLTTPQLRARYLGLRKQPAGDGRMQALYAARSVLSARGWR